MESQRSSGRRLLIHEADIFIETLNTLHGLKEVAHPQAVTLDENPLWRGAVAKQADAISPEKRDKFNATMVEALPIVLLIVNGARREKTDADSEKERKTFDPMNILPAEIRADVSAAQDKVREELSAEPDLIVQTAGDGGFSISFKDHEIRYHFWETIKEIERGVATPTHSALLMRSLLTMGVSAFEVLVSNVYRAFLTCNPSAADNPEIKAFSLKDLFDFGSVQDAIDESIFQQADSFSRKGVRAWASWFKAKPLEIDLSTLADDWLKTQEIFERRNVVIHNGSRVTRQYLNNVDASLTDSLTEGDPIDISPQYVDEALERLLTLGTLLSYRVRLKLFRRDELSETSDWISNEQFNLLNNLRFAAVQKIAACAVLDELTATNQYLIKVNGWIAEMQLRGVDACRRDIEQWDTSALSNSFRMARQVLLRQDKAALAAIKGLLDSRDLTIENVAEWPLFSWMREDGVLDDLIADRTEPKEERMRIIIGSPVHLGHTGTKETQEGTDDVGIQAN